MRVVALCARLASGLTLASAVACGSNTTTPALPGSAAQAEQGRLLLRQFGCGGCHRIPGVAGAAGTVGPPLDDVGRRVYVAGLLPNSPENMRRFIRAPQSVDPKTAMPNLGVTEPHAEAMVAYLYRLR